MVLRLLLSRGMDEPESVIAAGDAELVRRIDAAVATATAGAGGFVSCSIGCTACCIGPFPITVLDVRRLRSGLAELRRRRRWQADAIEAVARAQWTAMAAVFPGTAADGGLGDDEQAIAAFMERFADVPCPALEPGSGACLLYPARPVSCRLFGLPVAAAGEVAAPCELNFAGADRGAIAAAAVGADPGGLEARLLALLGGPPETVIAAALAGIGRENTQSARRDSESPPAQDQRPRSP